MKKLTSKLIFDVILTAVWTILMLYSTTGSLLHEILGLVILALFIIHIAYNIGLMRREIPYMFRSNSGTITVRYILVLLLTAGIIVTGISGVLISKDLLTGIQASDLYFWTALHHWAAYITLILIGIHIGLHIKMIGGAIARPFRDHPALVTWMRRGWNVVAALLIVCGSIASLQYELPAFAKATPSSTDGTTDVPESDTLTEAPEDQSNLLTISYTYPSYESTASEDETLEEYLGSQICTICPKCCPLTALRCSRGQSEVERATQEYYASHGDQTDQYENSDPSDETYPFRDDYSQDENDQSGDGDIWDEDDIIEDETDADENAPVSEPDLPDILSIMGLYVGGTYYVSQITDSRRRRRRNRE